jgi:hypothetical protein
MNFESSLNKTFAIALSGIFDFLLGQHLNKARITSNDGGSVLQANAIKSFQWS